MKRFNKVYIEISNVCNLNCSFCHGTKRPKTVMSPESFYIVLDKIRPYTDFIYYHVLGEPLLHRDFGAMLECAAAKGFKSCITTNGSLLKDRGSLLIDFINNELSTIQADATGSVNPPDVPVLRGKEYTAIKSSSIHKISISLQAQEANAELLPLDKYMDECCSFAKTLEGRTIISFRLWNEGGMDSNNPEIIERLHGFYPGEWKQHPKGFTIGNRTYLESDGIFRWPDYSEPDYPGIFACYGLKDQIGILADGTVVPCCLDADGSLALGNIFEEDLEDILKSPRASAIHDGFRHGHAAEELCRRCGYARRFVKDR